MKIRHKKWLYAAVFLTSALLLTGCDSKEERAVKQAVSAELDQLKSPDKKTIETYLSAHQLFPEEDTAENDSEKESADPEIIKIFSRYFKNFSYTVDTVKAEEKKASATVTITNLDAHALAEDYTAAALKKRITCDANPSQVEFSLKDSYLLLGETLKKNDYKQVDTTFDLKLKKDGETWTIVHSEDLDNQITGGFLTYMADSDLLPPPEVVKIHFNTIKEFDTEQLNIYLSLDSLLDTDDTYSSSIAHAMAEQIQTCFDFEILDTQNDERNALVKVRITSSDFKSIVASYQEQLSQWLQTSQAMAGGAEGRREKERQLLLESIEQNQDSTTRDVDISLINDGTSWKMQMDENVAQAILGGVDSALADVSEDVE